MTDWQAVLDADLTVPDTAPLLELVAELSTDLASPDPVRRDRHAYTILATWIKRGVLDEAALRALGEEQAARFSDERIQARTFAPLILAAIVERGVHDERWRDAFVAWYPAETDLRGHDPSLGWLHAIAHGADLLGVFGMSPHVEPGEMLETAAFRLIAPTEHVWRDQEDDRLAFALGRILTRPDVSETVAVGWLDPIASLFAAGTPGPVPPHVSNALRTLRALYLLADRGVRPKWSSGEPVPLVHRDALTSRLADVVSGPAPFTG